MLALVGTLILVGFLAIYVQSQWPREFPRSYPRYPDPDEELEPPAEPQADAPAVAPPLIITILGMASDNGTCRVALYDSPEAFNNVSKAALKADLPIHDRKAEWILPGRPKRPIAIAAYHDENANGQLDKNLLGIPNERFGFSNGARESKGPPSYEEAVISQEDLHEPHFTIRLQGLL
jgi:uncharacterized protein (DUF2141 family)